MALAALTVLFVLAAYIRLSLLVLAAYIRLSRIFDYQIALLCVVRRCL